MMLLGGCYGVARYFYGVAIVLLSVVWVFLGFCYVVAWCC